MRTAIDHLAESYGFDTGPFVALCIGLFLLTGGLIFIGGVFASRIIKSRDQKLAASLRFRYQKILNKIIVNETFSEEGAPDAAFEYYMAELRLVSGSSRFARQLLLTQILKIKKSLTGNSVAALVKTYYAMALHRESLHKLTSSKWEQKALAIRELAEMGYGKSAPMIEKFLYSNNQTLQQESVMALVRLESEPLSFLNHYTGQLSLWMRINLYHYLQQIDHRKLPLFSQYFNHPNLSVRLFSISMTRCFKQTSSLSALAGLLYSDNAKVVALTISALGEMEAFQHRDVIARLSTHVWRFENLSKRVVQCLGNIGDKETDVTLIEKFLSHPCYSVRFEAVTALKKLGSAGEDCLHKFRAHDNGVDSIFRHLSDPLLK